MFPPRRAALREIGIGADALEIIKIKEHRRTFGGRKQKIFELSEGTRAEDVALVGGDEVTVGALVDKHIEVVEPEIGHHLFELAVAVGGAQDLGLHQLIGDHRLRSVHGHDGLALLGRHVVEYGVAVGRIEAARKDFAFHRRHLHQLGVAILGRHGQHLFGFVVGLGARFA